MSGMKVPPPAYDESISVGHFPPSPQFPPQQQPIISNAQPQQSSVSPPTDLDEHLGPYPQQAYCQTCKGYLVTQTKHVSGLFTWILVFLFILFGLFCGCCLLPLCVKSCKDVEHRCPQCKTYLGTFQRVFGTRRNPQRVPIIRRAYINMKWHLLYGA